MSAHNPFPAARITASGSPATDVARPENLLAAHAALIARGAANA